MGQTVMPIALSATSRGWNWACRAGSMPSPVIGDCERLDDVIGGDADVILASLDELQHALQNADYCAQGLVQAATYS
jgi:hypothetical protein